ncbi:MAG: hypothetical protein H0T12_05490 [Actinobacteria bacterium]|nr:hypothetical protein [Actinomycetota bacterium]
MWVFPLSAAGVAGAFSLSLSRGWWAKRRPNLLAWAVALAMFALASGAAAWGLFWGWSGGVFRTYYLFGAVINVPVLGLGSLYLLAPRPAGHVAAAVVAGAALWASYRVIGAPLNQAALITSGIPAGSAVINEGSRALSRIYSYTGFVVVVGGAVWSAYRLGRRDQANLRRLATANALIALGTLVVAVASGFARYGRGTVFAVGLLAGICVMFAGFLKTRPGPG